MTQGTIEDLVEYAAHAGQPMKPRTITEWVQRGLLDHPDRQSLGRGRGSNPGTFPDTQRQLFMLLLHHRQTVDRLGTLARIPVAIWIYWGDDYVPLRQTRLALKTWLGLASKPPKDRAREAAKGVVGQLAHPDARLTPQTKLTRLLTDAIYKGRIPEPVDEVSGTLALVFDPHGTGRTIGPPGIDLSVEKWLDSVLLREQAIFALNRSGGVTDDMFNWARQELANTLVEYKALQIGWALNGTPAEGFREGPDIAELVNSSCQDLLLTLGVAVRQRGDQQP